MSYDMNMKDIHEQCLTNRTNNNKCVPVYSHVITVDQVKFAINKLKSGKSYCISEFSLSVFVYIPKNKKANGTQVTREI